MRVKLTRDTGIGGKVAKAKSTVTVSDQVGRMLVAYKHATLVKTKAATSETSPDPDPDSTPEK